MKKFKQYKDDLDFHNHRKQYINASEIPILANLAEKYQGGETASTPLELWREKLSKEVKDIEISPYKNAQLFFGTKLEKLIEDVYWFYYCSDNKLIKTDDYKLIQRKTYCTTKYKGVPCNASADFVYKTIDGELKICEFKTASFFSTKRSSDNIYGWNVIEDGKEGLPLPVYLQVQWQLYCYGDYIKSADVALLSDTNKFYVFKDIKLNQEVMEDCLELAYNFWECVRGNNPPSIATAKDALLLFGKPKNKVKVLSLESKMPSDTEYETLQDLLTLRNEIKKTQTNLKETEETMKTYLLEILGENKQIDSPEGGKIVSRTVSDRYSLTKEYKEIMNKPEIKKEIIDLLIENKIKISATGIADIDVLDKLKGLGLVQSKESQTLYFGKLVDKL